MASISDSGIAPALPLPPLQYIALYSDENIKRGRAHKPPPPPDVYTMFGRPFNSQEPIIMPLESQGIKRLYPQHFDRRRELKKLNHSLLVNFLDLIDILIKCPDSPKRAEKVDDISVLFIHIHHLVNEYRPYQAYDTLRSMLKLQKRQRIETTLRFQKHIERATAIVHRARESLPDIQVDATLMENVENLIARKKLEKRKRDDDYKVCTIETKLMSEMVDECVKSEHKRKRKKKL